MPLLVSTASAFDQFVVLGDSLSDSGNAGRASNGPVWVEYLAERYGVVLRPSGLGGSNFAIGGARLNARSGPSNLRAQADLYLRTSRPAPGTLHIVYGGGNDVLGALGHPDGDEMIDAAASSLRSIVSDLIGAGAADILVPNLPDVGMTPAVRGQGREAVEAATQLTHRFNVALDHALEGFPSRPGVRLHRLDVRSLVERVQRNPTSVGLVDVTTPCSGLRTCEGYLFWDGVHPTTRAHERLAETALDILPPC
jgi:phospholipase/lecithinase/hemolysin